MNTYEVAVVFPISASLVFNAFVGAFESGYSPWIHQADLIEGTKHDRPNLVWWGEEIVFANPFKIALVYDAPDDEDGEGNGRKTITNEDVLAGLKVMATKEFSHFNDLITENDDAITHDVFIQCIIFGEVIYG